MPCFGIGLCRSAGDERFHGVIGGFEVQGLR